MASLAKTREMCLVSCVPRHERVIVGRPSTIVSIVSKAIDFEWSGVEGPAFPRGVLGGVGPSEMEL